MIAPRPGSFRRPVVATQIEGPRRIVDAEGLAEYLMLKGGKRTVYKLCERTELPVIRIGRRVRFDVDAVVAYFAEHGEL